MIAEIKKENRIYKIDLSKPIDISIPLRASEDNLTAWYVSSPQFTPVIANGFVGDVNKGGSVNFRDIFFNPHGHGTHTECVGHISKENYTINECLKEFFFFAQLITIEPEKKGDDYVITHEQVHEKLLDNAKAVIIRTFPNAKEKKSRQYSNTNPAYVDYKTIQLLIERGVDHLLIDTPSVDKEKDDGILKAHHTFWQYPENVQKQRTITELIYVDDNIIDGMYLLNIQIASFENDASPSKPVLFELIQ